MSKCLILGPGKISKKISERNISYIIFVDGGIKHRHLFPSTIPSHSIGDNDSNSSKETLETLLDTDKDRSDLFFALQKVPHKLQYLELHGFLFGRADHDLCNLGECYAFSQKTQAFLNFYSSKNILMRSIVPISRHEIQYKGLFSICSLIEQDIFLDGDLRYKGQYRLLPLSSQGLSNHSSGKIVISKHLAPLIIFYKDDSCSSSTQ